MLHRMNCDKLLLVCANFEKIVTSEGIHRREKERGRGMVAQFQTSDAEDELSNCLAREGAFIVQVFFFCVVTLTL